MFSSFCLLTKYEKRLGELGLSYRWKSKGNHTAVFHCLWGKPWRRQSQTILRSAQQKDMRQRSQLLWPDKRKKLFMVRVGQCWKRPPRKTGEPPCLWIFRSEWGKPVCNLIRVCNYVFSEWGMGLGDSQGSFQTKFS